MAWIYLIAAIALELLGTTALKLSDGFSRISWVGVMTASYAMAFYLLSLTVRTMPLGLAYGVWAGLGTLGAFVISISVFHSSATPLAWIGVLFVIGGVVMLNLGSSAH